ncbi:MAG TPA: ATP-dependent RecD-like DNA helicase [Clostridia bacterium]
MEQLSGIVERITYSSEETGYCVIKLKSEGFNDLVTVVGNLTEIHPGSLLSLCGEWKSHSKFGKQFCASSYVEKLPASIEGIEKYLGSGLIKGVGPSQAKKIVKRFKENTIKVIEEEPDKLLFVDGIGTKKLQMIKKAWQDQKEIKNVMIFLQDKGVSTSYAVKIYKTYGNDSIKAVTENPYRLSDDIWGIGFKTADKIAEMVGFDKNSYERCRAGILYTLKEMSTEGHCFLDDKTLIEKTSEVLDVKNELVGSSLKKMIEDNTVVHEEEAIYLPLLYYSETGTAKRIKDIVSAPQELASRNIDEIIKNTQRENNIDYDGIQINAIKTAADSKFMILTGGPGTGKTTTTLAVIKVFLSMGASILLGAPTGRAAKRMSEATGMEAKTIHRLLEYKPGGGYGRTSENPLECDVLIIDETSMVDILLMYSLLKAVRNETTVILVGDTDQLPSVGPGNVLRDIIESGLVSVVRLTTIFRQALGSKIITNAHRINKGELPVLKGGTDSDFFFIEEEEPEKVAEVIKELCTKRLPKFYGVDPVNDIQVLSPMQKGEIGTINLNLKLQSALNPSQISIKHGFTSFRLYDKVMQIKNNYDKNVFNGDIGTIKNIDLDERLVTISFDGNDVEYDVSELDEVVLAYAATIHKSQGSEYKIVVAPFTMQHYVMLQRNLLYTCITRAKKVLVLVGSKKAIASAVANNKTTKRNTHLAKRLSKDNIEPVV